MGHKSGKTKNPEKLDMEICQPPHSCFECPYSDCIRKKWSLSTIPEYSSTEVQMLRHVDECIGCPPELGCLGDGCPHRNVPRWFCDECELEVPREELRVLDGKQLCWGCFVEKAWGEAEEPEDES